MKFNIRGSNLKVTEAIKMHIEEKIGKLEKFLKNSDSIEVNVLIRTKGTAQIVEVTLPIKHVVLRAEERHDDLYAAVDLVSEKLEKQILKNKTRFGNKINHELIRGFKMEEIELSEEDDVNKIVKRKKMSMKPMDEEEAILQMNLVGHDFFVYYDYNNEAVCVLYRRKDGDYGLIVTS